MIVRFRESEPIRVSFGQPSANGVEFDDVIKGQDGYSPTVSVSKTGKTTTIKITDKNGEHTATVLDGDVATVPIDNRTLILDGDVIKVQTTNNAEEDNTLPITSAGAYTILGNLESFMQTI